jgi:hypothetical protein
LDEDRPALVDWNVIHRLWAVRFATDDEDLSGAPSSRIRRVIELQPPEARLAGAGNGRLRERRSGDKVKSRGSRESPEPSSGRLKPVALLLSRLGSLSCQSMALAMVPGSFAS